MTVDERNERIRAIFEHDCMQHLTNKGGDYGAYENFEDLVRDLGGAITIPQAIHVYFCKHYRAYRKWIGGGVLTGEPIREKLIDMANFLLMLAAWLDAQNESEESK